MHRRTCNHEKAGQIMCNASAMRGNLYCYDHAGYYDPKDCKYFIQPNFHDERSLLASTEEIAAALLDGSIDEKTGKTALYACQVATTLLKQIAAKCPKEQARKEAIKQREAQQKAELKTEQKVEEYKAIERARRELAKEAIADQRAFQKSEEEREAREAKERGDIPPEKQSFVARLITETYLAGQRKNGGDQTELESALEIKRMEHQLAYNKMMDRKEAEEKQAEEKSAEAKAETPVETQSKPPQPALPEAIRRLGSLA